MGQLYKLSFPNGKAYIGITSRTMTKRLHAHSAPSCDTLVGRAIRKFGKQHVVVTILAENPDWSILCGMEISAIKNHGTKTPNGYNVTDGGEGVLGHKHSDETKRKLSKATRRTMQDPKMREHLSKATMLSFQDPARRALQSVLVSKQIRTPESNAKRAAAQMGRKHTSESIAKMKESRKAICPPKVEKTCKHCGKAFLIKPSHADGAKYCSKPCSDAGLVKSVMKHCAKCGALINVKLSRDKRNKNNFCSISCSTSFNNLERYRKPAYEKS